MEIRRRVRFEYEAPDAVAFVVRTSATTLQAGDCVDVEVGARWTTDAGQPRRWSGIWVPCEVLTDTGSELVVKLA